MDTDALNTVGLNLPEPSELCNRIKSMAMLDAILSPEWQYRFFSFNVAWTEETQLGSVRDGSGIELFFVFTDGRCAFKINDAEHLSAMTNGATTAIPPEYLSVLSEPAFSPADFTAFGWFDSLSGLWHEVSSESPIGTTPLVASIFASHLPMTPGDYKTWAEEYYEVDIDIHDVKAIFDRTALIDELVQSLNNEISLPVLVEDELEIGYP